MYSLTELIEEAGKDRPYIHSFYGPVYAEVRERTLTWYEEPNDECQRMR